MPDVQPSPTAAAIPPDYEIHIEPRTGWLRVDWRELWEYRDLLLVLVRRDFLAKYKQTVLGPLWFILQPLLNTIVFTIVFNKVAGIETGGIPPLLFYLCALLPWGYFAQNVTTGAATFTNNAHLFGKVYFPRLIVPLSAVLSNLFALGLQFAVFFIFAGWYALRGEAVYFGPAILLSLPLLLITAALSLGLSLLISSSARETHRRRRPLGMDRVDESHGLRRRGIPLFAARTRPMARADALRLGARERDHPRARSHGVWPRGKDGDRQCLIHRRRFQSSSRA